MGSIHLQQSIFIPVIAVGITRCSERRGKVLPFCVPQKWVALKTDGAGTASSLVFVVFCADGEEIFQKPKRNIDLRLLSEDNGHHRQLLQILSPDREKAFHLNKRKEWWETENYGAMS